MAAHSTTQKWYVLQTKPQKEAVVCAQLCRQPEMFEVFFPKIRNRSGVRPLFPSYLFVRTLMDELKNYRLLKYTRGVLRVMGSREEGPLPVADEVIATIRSRMGNDGLVDQSTVYQMGQMVCIRRGPLKDLIGILEKPVSDEGRVQVLFKLLKYPIRAVVNYEDLALTGT